MDKTSTIALVLILGIGAAAFYVMTRPAPSTLPAGGGEAAANAPEWVQGVNAVGGALGSILGGVAGIVGSVGTAAGNAAGGASGGGPKR